MNKKALIAGAAVAGIVIIGGGVASQCLVKVPAGYVAGLYSVNGGVKEKVLSNGWHLTSPMDKASLYSVATEQLYMSANSKEGSEENDSFNITCKDGTINVDLEMSYSFDGSDIPKIMKKYRGLAGEEIMATTVRGKIKRYASEEAAKYTVMDAYVEKKSQLNKDLQTRLTKELKEYGIVVESASFSEMRPDEKLATAIKERAKANEELEKIKIEKQISEQKAEKAKIEAKGKADAKLIEAEGKAAANKKVEQSLTPEILKQQAIEAWKAGGSKVPEVIGGGTSIIRNK